MTSVLIATVSAAIYDSLFLSAGVGVEGLSLVWDDTDIDSGLSATIQGAYCTLSGLKAPQGGNRTYTKAIGLKNTGGTSTTFDIEVVDVTGSGTTDLDYIFVEIYNGSDTLQGNLTVWENGAKGTTPVTDLTISAGDARRLQWKIAWKATADTSDTVTVSLKVTTPSPP
ncbi:MAG: hypothetical protein QHH12_03075 [Candidatus Bathyarchaeota archaeon]|nr:hypothetical protein [Candidatus Bathyarchaeota archaeon A05DMB-3]MDH7606738.1 hypothetical protein [Candidatus Bathyarchaeota archaeon]